MNGKADGLGGFGGDDDIGPGDLEARALDLDKGRQLLALLI
jgi:hypothetical protein